MVKEILLELGIEGVCSPYSTGIQKGKVEGHRLEAIYSPADGQQLGEVAWANSQDYNQVVEVSKAAFLTWSALPAPARGEIVRQIGQKLRTKKEALGKLVSLEMGKILQEGLGEVQEMIDICDFAVGLSRQLYGLTMHSERKNHRMYEQYHPLGCVGIISAFNFPVAVWSWNAMIAAVCGDTCIWKPSEKTPLTAVACQNLVAQVLEENNLPEGIFSLVLGGREIGELMAADSRLPLISATGSTAMGKSVGQAVAKRLGRSLLELGGNNAIIITEQANLDMAIRAVVFGAVGTCGQRCTSTRRLIVHKNLYQEVKQRLVAVYAQLPIGHPLEKGTLVGPLIDKAATANFLAAQQQLIAQGGSIIFGGEVLDLYPSGTYVRPALAQAQNHFPIVQHETFAPILYLIEYEGGIEKAIEIQNSVPQGLSSAVFTDSLREAELFLGALGSDCGIANVNIGTSGAEIGGAFGGEKETGGGRESGSDAWKAYMRRQTNTINYGRDLPLAQGIQFDW
jgi:aldehyde dehydrogenase (NAD+)